MRTKLLTKIVPVVLAGGGYSDMVLGYSPIAYWPLWEASGAAAEDISGNGFDGAYTGVTLGQDGIGDGNTCPLFDGTNDFLDFYSAGFSSAFNGELGTIAFWMKVFNAGVWEDGISRILIKIGDGDASSISIYKRTDNNNIRWVYDPEGSYEFLCIWGGK